MTTALVAGLHRDQYRHFALGTTASFSRLLRASDIGIIDLNHATERVAGIPILHGLTDLMAPAPGRGIGYAQVILELTGRGARGAGGHQIDGPEPIPQGFSGLMKDRVRCHRSLMTATTALIQLSSFNEISSTMVTTRTSKALRPFAFDEIPKAIPLGSKPAPELPWRHSGIHV